MNIEHHKSTGDRLLLALDKLIIAINHSFNQIQEKYAMNNEEMMPQLSPATEPIENNNPENPEIPMEVQAAIKQYEEIRNRLTGFDPKWTLPSPDPKTEASKFQF